MIDLHVHALPGLDDGPATLAEALELARAAAEGGTRTLVATPHIDHRWNVDPLQVREATAAFGEQLARHEIQLEVVPGGEVSIPRLLELDDEQVAAVRLGAGPYLLVEAPLSALGAEMEQPLFELMVRGHRVVLAHPERSPLFQRNPDGLARLVEGGALTSVTAGAFEGKFGQRVRRFALELVERGLVHDIASDAHSAQGRGPELAPCFAAVDRDLPGFTAHRDWFTRAVPEAILSGEPLPERPPPARRRRSFLARLRSLSD